MDFDIPHGKSFKIETIILDLNGTLTIDGKIIKGVKERLKKLKNKELDLILFSGDTRGTAEKVAKSLGLQFIKASTGKEKLKQAKKLNLETCAAVGNGLIDYYKIKAVKLGIVTLQAEGVHAKTLGVADIVVPSILDALDLFLKPQRLIATLRK